MASSPKRPRNLSLDAEAIERGERYSQTHGTNISRLVSDFLRSLPTDSRERPISPLVLRLIGVGKKRKNPDADYRSHLVRKYGAR